MSLSKTVTSGIFFLQFYFNIVKLNYSDCLSFININNWSSIVAYIYIMIKFFKTTPQYHSNTFNGMISRYLFEKQL